MKTVKWTFTLALGLAVAIAGPALAEEEENGQAKADTTATGEAGSHVVETLVVTATRTEQAVEDVPASVTVKGWGEIAIFPSDNFIADGLRTVPGTNVAQTTAADISISTRTATGVIPQGQLAMVDNRTVYQDFNGFVLWGTIPLEMEDVDRVEVVRGPGSAVWGANAMHGIVHLVTKDPEDMVGTRMKVKGGSLSTFGANLSHAGFDGRWGYRVSGGYDTQGAFSQPTGTIPGTEGPNNPEGTRYPEYENSDMERYRADGRLDFHQNDETVWSLAGGYAGLEGIFTSPGGPASMDSGTYQAFGKVDYKRKALRLTAFMNHDAYDGAFLNGNIPATTADRTYNFDFSDTRNAGLRHALTYGGNIRYNTYDNDLTPLGDDRRSLGAFLQDDILLTSSMRLVLGARWDNIDPMGDAISPRASLLVMPTEGQRIRLSYNRAFQAPSVLQNYAEIPNVLFVSFPDFDNPGSGDTVTVPIFAQSTGNPDLEAKQLDAFEIGWMGRFGNTARFEVAGYWNEFRNSFQTIASQFYTADNPPGGWPFDPGLLDGPLAGMVPSAFSFVNLGQSTERGVEVGGSVFLDRHWTLSANWSWQDEPELSDYTAVMMPDGSERYPVNSPPKHRVNVGLDYDSPGLFGSAAFSYQDQAFWTDVLDSRGWGPTEAFTMVNARLGVRFPSQGLEVSASAVNLFDSKVQQHVWGDFIGRRVLGEVTYRF
jgi:iron complex outermembrane receptor protein